MALPQSDAMNPVRIRWFPGGSVTILLRNRKYVGKWRNPWREAPSAPPLGELLSEREAEGVRYEI